MRIQHIISFLLLTSTLLSILSCSETKSEFYKRRYHSIKFNLVVPNALQLTEMYQDKRINGGISLNVDSSGKEEQKIFKEPPASDTSIIVPEVTTSDPLYFFTMIKPKNGWNMNFTGILSAKWQDTAVVYDLNRIRQRDFQELYVFGPGKDSAFYAGNTFVEVEKNGNKLIKISNAEDKNTTYTGMVGKYWFMFQFIAIGNDSVWVRQIWEQSSFD